MTRRMLLLMAALVAALPGCAPTTAVVGFGSASAAASTDVAGRPIGAEIRTDILTRELLGEVNDYRARHSLPPLSADPTAFDAADWMARYQAKNMTMTHTSSVAGMEEFDSRYLTLGGVRPVAGAENIAWHQLRKRNGVVTESYDELAARIVDGWIDSPPHRKNMLLSGTRGRPIAGLGVARGTSRGADGVYSTLDIFYVNGTTAVSGG